MKWQTKAIAALAALSMLLGPVGVAAPSISTSTAAKLTEAHGNIFKRGFVDWTKDAWGNPEPAAMGDTLEEGMQLGTGEKSWAQVTWPNVTTRAWANTVFAVAPNQRLVYLMGGEMLFNLDKNRNNKKDYVVWTKVLQARIRGTTVLVQATKELSRITVLEGCVDVMNRLDRSVIRVTPGVVYEIRTRSLGHGYHMQPIHRVPQEGMRKHERRSPNELIRRTTETTDETSRNSLQEPSSSINTTDDDNTTSEISSQSDRLRVSSSINGEDSLNKICSQNKPPLSVFETSRSTTSLYIANADNLQEHPLVNKFDGPLVSLPLVQSCLSKLPPVCHENIPRTMGSPALESNLLTNNSRDIASINNPSAQHKDVAGQAHQSSMLDPSIVSSQTDPVIIQNMEIVRVPTAMDYKVGPLIGIQVALPAGAVHNFPPVGLIGTDSNMGLHSALPTQAHEMSQVLPPNMDRQNAPMSSKQSLENVHSLANEQTHNPNLPNGLVEPNMMSRSDINSVRNIVPYNAQHNLPPYLSNSALMGPNIMPRPDMSAVRNLMPINRTPMDRTFDRPPLMIAPNLLDGSSNFFNPNLPPK